MKFLFLTAAMLLSSAAMAQDYGLTVGVHQTSASLSNSPGSTVGGKLGFDAGLTASFELVPQLRFRTGLLYDQRAFDIKTSVGTFNANFAYLDVPVNVQYNFTPMYSIYGGLIVGIKASDDIKAPAGLTATDPEMKSMYPLINVGGNFLFDDMYGFDVYYEMGMGDFAKDMKNYSTFGMHFIYWL